MEKVKPIIIRYEDGREYTLEFNRASVMFAEQRGFDRENIGNRMMTCIPELFWYAFRMHHPNITKQQSDAILFDDLGGISDSVSERLVELFNEPYMSLINEGTEPKNSQMKVIL